MIGSRTRFVVLLLAFALFLGVLKATAEARDVPKLTGPVMDMADMISPQVEEELRSMLKGHFDQHGDQVVVVTMPSLSGETIETVSLRLARTWALGQAVNDNGVLILVAQRERKIRIEVGDGLSNELSNQRVDTIIKAHMVPSFRASRASTGVRNGVVEVLAGLRGEAVNEVWAQDGKPSGHTSSSQFFSTAIGFFFLGTILFFAIKAMRIPRNVSSIELEGDTVGRGDGVRRNETREENWLRKARRRATATSKSPKASSSRFSVSSSFSVGGGSSGFSRGGGSFSGGGASGGW